MKKIVFLLFVASSAWAGLTKAQTGVAVEALAGTTVSCVFASNPSAGDLITVAVNYYGGVSGTTIASIQDSNSNAYTVTPNSPSTYNSVTGQVFLGYLLSAPANATNTITATTNNTIVIADIFCDDWTVTGGSATFDNDFKSTGNGATVNTPTVNVSGNSRLLYGSAAVEHVITSANSPWTGNDGGVKQIGYAEWISSTASNTALNFTVNVSGDWSSMGMAIAFSSSSTSSSGVPPHPYTTTFPLTQNPISENGYWVSGATTGLDWGDVQTSGGKAYGTSTTVQYSDPTANLTGVWGPSQSATGVVFCSTPTASYFQEVEIRLRSTIAAHSATGYEILWRCLTDSNAYTQVARWNGALGDFTYLDNSHLGVGYGVADGDTVGASIVGNVITVYRNGAVVFTTTDSSNTWTTGAPGLGFNYGVSTTYTDFGYTDYTATDNVRTVFIQGPTKLTGTAKLK